MKRFGRSPATLFWILPPLISALLLSTPLTGHASATKYTFMVYMNGTDLESEGAASANLPEMMEVGSNKDVSV